MPWLEIATRDERLQFVADCQRRLYPHDRALCALRRESEAQLQVVRPLRRPGTARQPRAQPRAALGF